MGEVKRLNKRKDAVYAKLMKKAENYGVRLIDFKEAGDDEEKFLERYFDQEIALLSVPDCCRKAPAISIFAQ